MRVLVNMLGVRAGGARTYLLQMLNHLATTRQPHEYVVLAAPWVAEQWPHATGTEQGAVRLITMAVPPARRLSFDQFDLPRIAVRERCDVLWSPNNYASFRSPVPQLVMICNPVYFSDRYQSLLRRYGTLAERADYRLRRLHARASVRRADVAVFPTRAFMDGVVTELGAGGVARPHALHHGFDAPVTPRTDTDRSVTAPIKVFYPTSWAPHKNFGVLFEAAERLAARRVPFELWLTLDGQPYTGPYRRWFASDVAQLKDARASVRWTGYLTPDQIAARYAAADVVVFPSWLETFGYPLAEARAAGVPLVAADTATNREVAGESADYHPPFDADAMAETIVRAANRRPRADRHGVVSWSRHFAELGQLMETMA